MKTTELPMSVLIGCLGDISKKDAESYCRSLIEKFTGDPLNSFFLIKEVDNELFYEIQEGGNGKAYLSSVIQKIKQGPGDIIVPSVTRYLKVRVKDDGKIFQILPENDKPSVSEGIIRQEKMVPYQRKSKVLFAIGAISALVGMGVLLSSYVTYETQVRETPIQTFNNPMLKFPDIVWEMDKITSLNPSSYVSKLEYKNTQWSIKTDEISTEVKSEEVDWKDMRDTNKLRKVIDIDKRKGIGL